MEVSATPRSFIASKKGDICYSDLFPFWHLAFECAGSGARLEYQFLMAFHLLIQRGSIHHPKTPLPIFNRSSFPPPKDFWPRNSVRLTIHFQFILAWSTLQTAFGDCANHWGTRSKPCADLRGNFDGEYFESISLQ
jgi:hypothetical protein